MSWAAVVALCAASYGLKALGAVLASRAPEGAGQALEGLVVPVIAALIVVQTVGGDEALVIDGRLPALAVAALLVWRGAPLLAVVVAAACTAAVLHALGA